jgi:hypothetical protein
MRDFKGMKRQRGRNRGGGGGGGGKPQQNANRAFDSNGPDNVKVRGNAQHVFEKYQQLARDAQTSGDRVLAENYLQHAEHYFRLLRAMQPQRPASEILGRDQFASGYDIDFEDEGAQSQAADEASEGEAGAEGEGGEPRERNGWQDRGEYRQRDDRPRDDRPPRDDRFRDENRQRDGGGRQGRWRDDRPRDDRPRDDRPRDDRPRDDRPVRDDRPPRDDRPRAERPDRDDRPRSERPEREPRPERDPLAVVEPQAAPLPVSEERPSPVLRDAEGGESHAPAFLQNRAAPAAEPAEAAPKPRRRRAPRTFDAAAETPAASTESEEV